MEHTSRRSFAKTLGLLGLVATGVEAYKETTKIVYRADELPTAELEKQLEGKPVLQLHATYGEEIPAPTYNQYAFNSQGFLTYGKQYKEGTEINVKVNIVPGPDGKLYVKENDTWRKI